MRALVLLAFSTLIAVVPTMPVAADTMPSFIRIELIGLTFKSEGRADGSFPGTITVSGFLEWDPAKKQGPDGRSGVVDSEFIVRNTSMNTDGYMGFRDAGVDNGMFVLDFTGYLDRIQVLLPLPLTEGVYAATGDFHQAVRGWPYTAPRSYALSGIKVVTAVDEPWTLSLAGLGLAALAAAWWLRMAPPKSVRLAPALSAPPPALV
jgi:hypothetical protein